MKSFPCTAAVGCHIISEENDLHYHYVAVAVADVCSRIVANKQLSMQCQYTEKKSIFHLLP